MKIFTCFFACFVVSAAAWSQTAQPSTACTAKIEQALAKNIGIKWKAGSDDDVTASACKVWPYDQTKLLAAIAFNAGVQDTKVFAVAIADASSGKVLSSYNRSVEEDTGIAFGKSSLRIDTAPYQLAESVRAFGVRFTSDARGASCPDGIWRDELTLFVPEKNRLRPVLKGLAMNRSEARSGCFGHSSSDLVFDEATLSLTLAPTSSHGFKDLLVTASIRRQGDLVRAGAATTERYLFRYDGQTYLGAGSLPWWLTLMSE